MKQGRQNHRKELAVTKSIDRNNRRCRSERCY